MSEHRNITWGLIKTKLT